MPPRVGRGPELVNYSAPHTLRFAPASTSASEFFTLGSSTRPKEARAYFGLDGQTIGDNRCSRANSQRETRTDSSIATSGRVALLSNPTNASDVATIGRAASNASAVFRLDPALKVLGKIMTRASACSAARTSSTVCFRQLCLT
jgi:hypothetical protein